MRYNFAADSYFPSISTGTENNTEPTPMYQLITAIILGLKLRV